ncbi:MAG: natural resistance-associated macrophage protein [Acidimicrobiales bacterium]|nr:natural resistance-associated macrophage protein [Acidimicrobiales bacterium]
MKRVLEVALGILTAIGGFVDIGELVAAPAVGARFGMSLAWATVLSLIGIMLFAEMAGRVAAVSHRPVFDLVRERLGPRLALVNLTGSLVITVATVAAEIGGVALALELATSINYLLWVPLVVLLVWIVIWRINFEVMENLFGLLGLALLVTAVGVWRLNPDWGNVAHLASHPSIPHAEGKAQYFYWAIAMFGAGFMPYEVLFFSSGAVEQKWSRRDLVVERANVIIGFPLGALVTLALMLGAALVFQPRGIHVTNLYQATLPTSVVLGKWALISLLVGFFACTFGAALETALSCGYAVGQYFGWQWGKTVEPRDDARFHLSIIGFLCVATGLVMTSIDPLKITEFVIVLSAAALPLTYLPVLIVANDPDYMGDQTNSRFTNSLGFAFLLLLIVISVATVPLMIITKGGGS